ncbi:MAG: hypothetical protein Fur0022_31180 [Anaerolineales bacterium]
MKKMFALGLILGAILALGGMAFSVYSATSANAAGVSTPGFTFGRDPFFNSLIAEGNDTDGDHPLQPYVEEAVAGILGLTVEELQAARDEGTRTVDLIEAAGLTVEEFRTALAEATPAIVEQALADGAITQEQADLILENGLRVFGCGGPGKYGGGFGGFGLHGDGVLQPYVEEAAAEILGMTVEELQTARDEGTRTVDLIEAAGLTTDEFQTAMEEALPGIVEKALADGVITQTQADYILENGLRGAKGYLRSALQEYIDAATADLLGVTVEELQAAREEGTVADLLAAAGLTREDLKTALEEATPGIIEQALAEGLITQEQADYLLENGLPFRHHGGGHGGHGPHGDGFGGPGWFGPGNQDPAPTTETSSENG